MIHMMERKKIWFLISALLLVPGIVSLLVWQLKLGIDFKGGSLTEFSLTQSGDAKVLVEQGSGVIKKSYEANGVGDIQIQTNTPKSDEIRFFVKSPNLDEAKHRDIVRRLEENHPKLSQLSFETIDPQVGADVTRKAMWAIVIASLVIIIYIALSFRGVPKPTSSWQFGVFAVIALLHDVLFIIGFYSLMGHFVGWEVKSEFVTAALTVMGFSVHDTIVVFDRLRENLKRFPASSFRQVANMSVAQTMSRSLNTSLTVILVLLAVVLLGGETIRPFATTLLVGIAVGTYSSIFVATPLLDWWQETKFKTWLRQSGRNIVRRFRSLRSPVPSRRKTETV